MPEGESRNDPRFASTIAHGMALLECFAAGRPALTNKELAAQTGLSKATVSRLTSALQATGLILFDAQVRRYRLAPAALTLGYPLLAGLNIHREARASMQELADDLGATVSLGIRDRTRMVYVETSQGKDPIAFRPEVGAALPMLRTAMGRAWLAAAPSDLRCEVLSALRAEAPDDYSRWAVRIEEARKEVKLRGFCHSLGDWKQDIHAVAVPLDGLIDAERLVINCGVVRHRLGPNELVTKIGPRLVELAQGISLNRDATSDPHGAGTMIQHSIAGESETPARTLIRGIDLLFCFRPGETTLSHSQLARRAGLSGPTAVRLIHTLAELGYLRREATRGSYRLGGAALALGYPLLANMRVRQVARPLMQAFSQDRGVAVSLGFRHRTHMVYAETAWRMDDRSATPDTGAPIPMLSTAMGRAWLCHASAIERQKVLSQLRLEQPQDYARFAAALENASHEFGINGYCSSRGDCYPDVYGFAVPLSKEVDGSSFVMNCGVLATQHTFEEARKLVAVPLRSLVREIEIAIGTRSDS